MPRRSGTPGLLPLLRSQTQAGLLERLILHSEAHYTVAQLAEDLGVTEMSVRRELDRMLAAGIVEREAVGRQGLYRASTASPLYEPLRELIEKSVGAEALLREVLDTTDGLQAAILFGSWARERIDAESDIDLLVIGDLDYGALLDRLMSLQSRTGREISVVWMRPEELHQEARGGLIRDIQANPFRLLVGHLPKELSASSAPRSSG